MTTTHLTPFGRPALDALRALVVQAKAGDPLRLVTVVVPDNVTALSVRRFLAAGAVAGIVVTTLTRLAEQWAAPRLAPRVPATSALIAAHWRRVLAEEPGVFAAVADHPATARALVRAHRELRQVDGPGLEAVAATGAVQADLVRMHRIVVERTTPECYDDVDLLLSAARTPRDAGAVVLVAPTRLSRAEQQLVRVLGETGELRVLACVTRVRRADGAMLDSLRGAGIAAPEPPAEIVQPTASELADASDADDEVRALVRRVVVSLQHTPAHRIAVLYPAAVPYARLLHERFAAAGVTTNGTGVSAVTERAVVRAFLGLLRLERNGYQRADVIQVLGEAPLRLLGEIVHLTTWDRIARRAGVIEGADWDRRLHAYASDQLNRAVLLDEQGRDSAAELARTEAQTAEELRSAIAALRRELEAGAVLRSWTEVAAWLTGLLEGTVADPAAAQGLPPQERYALVALRGAVEGLAALDAVGQAVVPGAVVDVLELQLDAAVPRVGRFGEGVYVARLGEAALLDVDEVHMVGLAEDLCPGRMREDALLPDGARRAAGLPPTREKVDDTHRAVLGAFASSPRAVASFPRGDLRRSTHRQPSRFLLPTLRHLVGDHTLAASDWETVPALHRTSSPSFAASLLTTDAPSDEQEWRTRAGAAGVLGDPVVDAAREMLAARRSEDLTRFDGNLTGAAQGLPDFADGVAVVAPTTLEQIADCPHSYFVSRVLGVSPLEAPEEVVVPPASEVGNLVHHVLDRLVSEAQALPRDGAPWSEPDRARALAVFEEEAERLTELGLMGHQRLWALEREALRRDLMRMLDDDDAWRAANGATVLASELVFGIGSEPPVEIATARGVVRVRGSADRVDRLGDGTLVVTDLKTGSFRTFKDLEKDAVAAGHKLQLPAYAQAAQQRFGGDQVIAGYWFARRTDGNEKIAGRGKRIPILLDDDLQERYRIAVGTLVEAVATGVFPAVAPESADFSWVQCPFCNPDGIGHGEVRERWERQRRSPAVAAFLALTDPSVLDATELPDAVASGEEER